jgi:hypothetical protein
MWEWQRPEPLVRRKVAPFAFTQPGTKTSRNAKRMESGRAMARAILNASSRARALLIVVCIFVSTGDGHDPLREQFFDLVMDFVRLPLVFETRRKSSGQSQPSVSSGEQDRSAIRAALPSKLHDYWPIKNFRKQKTQCCNMFA